MTMHDFSELPVHGPNGRIAALRHQLRMKQVEFADAVGTSRETVSHWENLNEKGEPRQRTTLKSAAAIARLAREGLGWDVDASFFHRDEETAYDQLLHHQKKNTALLERNTALLEQLTGPNHPPNKGLADSRRFSVGDIVGGFEPSFRPDDQGVVLAVVDEEIRWRDFYCDPCDAHWSVPDDDYWQARIEDSGDYPDCPAKESPDCDPRRIRSYTTAIRVSQTVTVDFGGRIGGPAEFSGDHLRLITRTP